MELHLRRDLRYGLAFSGGVDSCCLLALLVREGYDVKAYTVRGAFQLERDMADADALVGRLGAQREVIPVDVWHGHEDILANPQNRCYLCKRMVFETILSHMAEEGRQVLLDGTNASDGLTKDDVRALSRELGLPTADKPSYACYAVYHPAGQRITPESLQTAAEDFWRERDGQR